MRSPQPATIVIACPHCGTRYQVPFETVGVNGRKVSCAHCGKAWHAEATPFVPPPPPPPVEEDRLFDAMEEERLDSAFVDAERKAMEEIPASLRQLLPKGEVPPPEVMRSIAAIKAAISPKPKGESAEPAEPVDPAEQQKAESKLARRQLLFAKGLPTARLRRVLRIAGFATLAVLIGGGALFRTDIVRAVPDLAGLYASVGLGVNLVGLDFSDVSTVISRRGDTSVISVNARIHGVEPRTVPVPPVVVTLLDGNGNSLYQWSAIPRAPDIAPGEAIDFSTELAGPPAGVKRVELSFANGLGRTALPKGSNVTTEEPAH